MTRFVRRLAVDTAISFARITLVVAMLVCAVWLPEFASTTTNRGDDSHFSLTPVESPANLIAAHDCWTGEAPPAMAGKMPGHVVVSVKGVAKYAGERMVGRAFEQLFDGADHGLRIHAFCR